LPAKVGHDLSKAVSKEDFEFPESDFSNQGKHEISFKNIPFFVKIGLPVSF